MPLLLFMLKFTFLSLRFTLPVSFLPTRLFSAPLWKNRYKNTQKLLGNSLAEKPVYVSVIYHTQSEFIQPISMLNGWSNIGMARQKLWHIKHTHTDFTGLLHLLSARHAEGGVELGVGVARLGVDVALITVQVEIVRAIDCASKCYTSHLSTFSLFFLLLALKKSTPLVKTLIACKFTETEILEPSH